MAVTLRDLMGGLRRTATRLADAEAALRELNQTPKQRVTDRSRALEAANRRLAAARQLETQGKLTDGVAPDINNLLQVLESELALLRLATEGARRTAIEATMAKAVERGTRLTRQLLAFARQQPLAPAPVDLGPPLHELCDMLAQSLRGDVTLAITGVDDAWPMMADRMQLDVSLLNLAVNAGDAMPDGGTRPSTRLRRKWRATTCPGRSCVSTRATPAPT